MLDLPAFEFVTLALFCSCAFLYINTVRFFFTLLLQLEGAGLATATCSTIIVLNTIPCLCPEADGLKVTVP